MSKQCEGRTVDTLFLVVTPRLCYVSLDRTATKPRVCNDRTHLGIVAWAEKLGDAVDHIISG